MVDRSHKGKLCSFNICDKISTNKVLRNCCVFEGVYEAEVFPDNFRFEAKKVWVVREFFCCKAFKLLPRMVSKSPGIFFRILHKIEVPVLSKRQMILLGPKASHSFKHDEVLHAETNAYNRNMVALSVQLLDVLVNFSGFCVVKVRGASAYEHDPIHLFYQRHQLFNVFVVGKRDHSGTGRPERLRVVPADIRGKTMSAGIWFPIPCVLNMAGNHTNHRTSVDIRFLKKVFSEPRQ